MTSAGQAEAYIVNIASETCSYDGPDEHRTHPHENDITYDWTQKDG